MKFFYRKFLTALLFLFFAFNAKAVNDTTLTIRQVFDWKVGDTLMYDNTQTIYFPSPPMGSGTVNQHSVSGFAVQARYDFQDTILYYLHWNYGFTDTFVITNLDTLVTKIGYATFYPALGGCGELSNMPTCDSSWANYYFNNQSLLPIDTLSSIWISYPQFETGWNMAFTAKVGLRYADYSAAEYWPNFPMGYSGGCGINLVYFKSDSLTWIHPDYYTYYTGIAEQTPTPSFRLYPNPATDELTITTETNEAVDVFVYDMLGNELRSIQNSSANSIKVKVSDLSAGYYLLKLTSSHGSSSTKGFIIAR